MKKLMWIVLMIITGAVTALSATLYVQNQKTPILGHKNGQLSPLPSTPNAISSQGTTNPVQALTFKQGPASTMSALLQAIHKVGHVTIISQQPNYLYVVFTSKWLRFKDDVEFYLNTEQKQVHIRSASRAGRSDLGINKKRYETISDYYNKSE